jgi:hypothetical protein
MIIATGLRSRKVLSSKIFMGSWRHAVPFAGSRAR